jgi:hypothetical protein
MELVSTIHYISSSLSQWNKQAASKEEVVERVYEIKRPKFSRDFVDRVYDVLLKARLLS